MSGPAPATSLLRSRPQANPAGHHARRSTGDLKSRRDGPVEMLISMGSNIEPEVHLPRALRALAQHPRLSVVSCSNTWRSEVVGGDGPPFLNAAVRIRTRHGWRPDPMDFKYDVLRAIERNLGRRRSEDRNAPRTIDLDLSFYDELVLQQRLPLRRLELPDPETLTRAHVALPLAEVAPAWRHPTDGRRLRQIARALDRGEVELQGPLAPETSERRVAQR